MQITGKIITYIYQNTENGYKVFIVMDEEKNRYTLTGYTGNLDSSLVYQFEVKEVYHKKYDLQYQIESYKLMMDSSKDSIISYLSSSLFSGVGLIAATNIYEALGERALELIASDKGVLDNVPRLTEKQKDIIYLTIRSNLVFENIYVELYKIGLSNQMIHHLYEKYQETTLDIIYENPYRLIYDIDNIGFITADNLALKLGFPYDHIERLKALLIYTFNNLSNRYGLTYLTKDQLLNSAYNYLLKGSNITYQTLEEALDASIDENKIIFDNDKYYLPYLFFDEVSIASKINKILENKVKKYDLEMLEELLNDFEEMEDISLEDLQKEAIIEGINNNISIITGGPGTGKTTIIKAIIYLYASLNGKGIYDEDMEYKVLLCAPTGKASKRINEQTKFKAMTIHRALGYNYENEFEYDENNLLNYKLTIVDESSMIDNNLASHLLKALKEDVKLIFVGDSFQLPSIAPGAFFKDLIDSGKIKTTFLKTIFRQRENSNIIKLSEMVRLGDVDSNIFGSNDLKYYECKKLETLDIVNSIIKEEIKNGYDLITDIEVLAPIYKTEAGIDNLNRAISNHFNQDYSFEIKRNENLFRENDKVIYLVNSKEYELMNGDIGVIIDKTYGISSGKEKELYIIDFDNKMKKLSLNDFDDLRLAYATSIHKAQGSEYPIVILVLNDNFKGMLKRKLLYTAISRAKVRLYIVGDIKMLYYGLDFMEQERQTSLLERIKVLKRKRIKIEDKDIPFDDLGEDNMDGITPYSFMH